MSLRRWLSLLALTSVTFVGVSLVISAWLSHPRVQPVTQPGPLVVIALPSLSWADISREGTPVLWHLAEQGAVGAQATRSPSGRSCSVQAWLIFAAGTPTDVGPGRCADVTPLLNFDGSAVFPQWTKWRDAGLALNTPEDLGAVASELTAAGQCVAAAGPDAGLGAANRAGAVEHYALNPEAVDFTTCPVSLVDLGTPDDQTLGRLIRHLPANTTLVVTGMAADGRTPTLRPVIMTGPGVPHGLLTSLSTRQPGVLQTADLSALVLSRLGSRAPILGDGRPPVVRPITATDAPLARVIGLTRALDIEYDFVPVFFVLFLGGSALAGLIGLLCWYLARRRRLARGGSAEMTPSMRAWLSGISAMCAAMPAATFLAGLVPWWNAWHPEIALCLTIIGISGVISGLAVLGPWRRRPSGTVAFMVIVTFFVLAQDVVHGSRLQFISLIGLQPVYGGRFYGQGNVAYAVFATTAIMIAVIVAGRLVELGQRRAAVVVVVFVGLTAVVIDGSPSWGADGGGPLAMVPAFGYLALKAGGERVTVRRIMSLGVATFALVGVFALFDYLGPAQYRTHLGDFVAQVIGHERWNGVVSIWTQNWTMLTSSWLTRTVPVLLVMVAVVALRPGMYARAVAPAVNTVPFLKAGLRAVFFCWVIAFFSNDSGTGIPPTGLLVLAPLLVLLGMSSGRPLPNPEPAPGPRDASVSAQTSRSPATGSGGSVRAPSPTIAT
ncbi:MAG: hypothetical protein JWQ32_274 [Marmoricola sp.]|nr:hypothetical protein [Marmoricola sp.]